MEELLNKLIKMWWKPRNKDYLVKLYIKYWDIQLRRWTENRPNEEVSRAIMSKRELVSKESGLRQFCVENKLVNKYADISDEEEAYIWKRKSWLDAIDIDWNYIRLDDDYDEYHQDTDYKYWLIESALKDESELEYFLLSNIKVKWK